MSNIKQNGRNQPVEVGNSETVKFNYGEEQLLKDPGPQNRNQRRAYATQRKLFFRGISKQAAKMANSADAQEAQKLLREKFGDQATLINQEEDSDG